jgi:hypothetical protein
MAISFVQGNYAGSTSSSPSNQQTITLNGVTAGNTVFVVVNTDGGYAPYSMTDSGGNTYSSLTGFNLYLGDDIIIFWSTTTTGGNLTFTCSGSDAFSLIAQEFSGVPNAKVDVYTSNFNINSGGTATIGPTSTTGHAEELVFGIFGYDLFDGPNTPTLGSGYSNLTYDQSTYSGDVNLVLSVESKVVSSTGTQTATMSWPVGGSTEGIVVTFYSAPPTLTGLSSLTGISSITF